TGNAAASTSGVAVTNNVPDVAPSTPALSAPANGVFAGTLTPTLGATFSDPDPADSGTIRFQVCADSSCASPIGPVFDSGSVANGAVANAVIPAGLLTADGTYYWRARGIDSASQLSAFSGTRSFTVDSTAPSASVVATPGTNPGSQYWDGATGT